MSNPLVIPAGFAQVTCSATNLPINHVNSFSFGCGLGSDEFTLANNIKTWFEHTSANGYAQYMSEQWQCLNVEVLGHTVLANAPCSTVGAGTYLPLPRQNSVKIKKITSARGKANKGYMYWFGRIPSDQVDDSANISSTVLGQVDDQLTALSAAISADTSTAVVLHHANSSVTTPTAIGAFQPINQVRTQRRRQTPRP